MAHTWHTHGTLQKMGTWEEIKVMCSTLDGSTSRAQNYGKIQCAMCVRRRLFRVCILPLTACLPLWAGEMRVRRSKTSRVEMKVDYLSLCYRGSDNPAFIWFCDFLSKASRLSCDYQSRALCLSDSTSATPNTNYQFENNSAWKMTAKTAPFSLSYSRDDLKNI